MMILATSNFGAVDWAIVVVYVVFSGAAGLLCRRYIRNISDYLVAGRSVGPYLSIATLSSTEMGLVTVMYMAEEGFSKGFAAFMLGIIMATAMIFLGATGFIVRPFRATGCVTVAEYYEKRFSRRVRVVGGIIIASMGILNMGMFPKMGGKFIQFFTGIEPTIEIGGHPCDAVALIMGVLLLIVVTYTVLGGMVSVVFTDYLQFLILAAGMAITTYYCMAEVSWSQMCEAVSDNVKGGGFNPFAWPGSLWIAWIFLLSVGAWATWQPVAFRTSSAEDEATTKPMFMCSGLTLVGRAVIPMLWGIGALTYFTVISPLSPEQLAQKEFSFEAMPMFLAEIVPSVIAGVLMAGMVAAFMSTFDSYLLSWAGVIVQDVMAPLRRDGLSQQARVRWSRLLVVVIAVFLFLWSVYYQPPETVWTYMALTGTSYVAGALALLVAGLYWRRASSTGAMLALIVGAVIPVGNMFMGQFLQWGGIVKEPPISSDQAGLATYIIAGAAMVLGSLMWPDAPSVPLAIPIPNDEGGN